MFTHANIAIQYTRYSVTRKRWYPMPPMYTTTIYRLRRILFFCLTIVTWWWQIHCISFPLFVPPSFRPFFANPFFLFVIRSACAFGVTFPRNWIAICQANVLPLRAHLRTTRRTRAIKRRKRGSSSRFFFFQSLCVYIICSVCIVHVRNIVEFLKVGRKIGEKGEIGGGAASHV